jgi:hypothetical protein
MDFGLIFSTSAAMEWRSSFAAIPNIKAGKK